MNTNTNQKSMLYFEFVTKFWLPFSILYEIYSSANNYVEYGPMFYTDTISILSIIFMIWTLIEVLKKTYKGYIFLGILMIYTISMNIAGILLAEETCIATGDYSLINQNLLGIPMHVFTLIYLYKRRGIFEKDMFQIPM